MATAAEPLPAELPLPGGRPGTTVRVHPLLTATMTAPPAGMHRDEGRLAGWKALGLTLSAADRVRFPVPAFLVEHPGAGLMLVDTGFHPSVVVEPSEAFGRVAGLIFKDLEMTPEQAVPGQMRDLGLDPDEVRTVVMTHLHSDHASGISQFPDATFVVSDAEWHAAASGGQLQGYQRHQFDHAFDYRLIDFDSAEADSFATFGRAPRPVRRRQRAARLHARATPRATCRWSSGWWAASSCSPATPRTRCARIADTALPYRMEDEHFFTPLPARDPALRRAHADRGDHPRARHAALGRAGGGLHLARERVAQAVRLPGRRHVDGRRLARPGDQVQRLEAVERVLEAHRLALVAVACATTSKAQPVVCSE